MTIQVDRPDNPRGTEMPARVMPPTTWCANADEWEEHYGRLPVVDATESRTLVLRSIDVNRGRSRDCYACAYAQSMKRNPEILAARFGATSAHVIFRDNPDVIVRFILGKRAQSLIREFDRDPDTVKSLARWADGAPITMSAPSKRDRKNRPDRERPKAASGSKRTALRHL